MLYSFVLPVLVMLALILWMYRSERKKRLNEDSPPDNKEAFAKVFVTMMCEASCFPTLQHLVTCKKNDDRFCSWRELECVLEQLVADDIDQSNIVYCDMK